MEPVTLAQGGAERVRPRGWIADFWPIWHFHRHFILTANTFRRSLNFIVLRPAPPSQKTRLLLLDLRAIDLFRDRLSFQL